jgi:hypothetical protein
LLEPAAIARFRVCCDAGIAPDAELLRAILAYVVRSAGAEARRGERDARVRRAGALLDGAPWARAGKLAAEAALLDRSWQRVRLQTPEAGTVRGELHAARLFMDLPESRRGFHRILVAAVD